MADWQGDVKVFMKAMDQEIRFKPIPLGHLPEIEKVLALRLIREEIDELVCADTTVEAVDAIVDSIYVLLGYANRLGVWIEPVFEEVHRSNMTKLGGEKRADGKQMKGSDYSPADVAGKLREQGLEE